MIIAKRPRRYGYRARRAGIQFVYNKGPAFFPRVIGGCGGRGCGGGKSVRARLLRKRNFGLVLGWCRTHPFRTQSRAQWRGLGLLVWAPANKCSCSERKEQTRGSQGRARVNARRCALLRLRRRKKSARERNTKHMTPTEGGRKCSERSTAEGSWEWIGGCALSEAIHGIVAGPFQRHGQYSYLSRRRPGLIGALKQTTGGAVEARAASWNRHAGR